LKLFHQPRNIPDAPPQLLDVLEEHKRVIEGNPYSEFEDIIATFGSSDTELRIDLVKLNRTPVAYMIVKTDRAVNIYDGDTSNAKNILHLKATVASAVVTLRVN
jgi:hypothetical protein